MLLEKPAKNLCAKNWGVKMSGRRVIFGSPGLQRELVLLSLLSSSQFAAQHCEWGGREGEVGSGAAGPVGEVPVGVVPQHAGAPQEQQHHREGVR